MEAAPTQTGVASTTPSPSAYNEPSAESRRAFLTRLGVTVAALGIGCPLAAQAQSLESTPADPEELKRLQQQLLWQRQESRRLLAALHDSFGEPLVDVVADYTEEKSLHYFSSLKIDGERNLQALKKTLWDTLPPNFKWEVLEESAEVMRMKVSVCPLVAELKEDGVKPELGYALFCASDPGIAAGINPAIKFTRTQTLMQGHPCCDHCYELKRAAAAGAMSADG